MTRHCGGVIVGGGIGDDSSGTYCGRSCLGLTGVDFVLGVEEEAKWGNIGFRTYRAVEAVSSIDFVMLAADGTVEVEAMRELDELLYFLVGCYRVFQLYTENNAVA